MAVSPLLPPCGREVAAFEAGDSSCRRLSQSTEGELMKDCPFPIGDCICLSAIKRLICRYPAEGECVCVPEPDRACAECNAIEGKECEGHDEELA